LSGKYSGIDAEVFDMFFLYIKAVFAHWFATVGILLTLTPFVPDRTRKWVEVRMKQQFSLKHLWIVGAVLLGIAFYQAWVDEHYNATQLIKDKDSISRDMEFWKNQSYAKDEAIRKRDELLDKNFTTLTETQRSLTTLSNTILNLTVGAPEITTIPLRVQEPQLPGKFSRHFLLLTNKIVSPVKLTFGCSGAQVYSVEPVPLPPGAMIGGAEPLGDGHTFRVEIATPPWTSTHPIVLETVIDKDDSAQAGCRIFKH
jgi:hypothetical protein